MRVLFIDDRDLLGCPFCRIAIAEVELRNNLLGDEEFYWIVNTEDNVSNLNEKLSSIARKVGLIGKLMTPTIVDGNIAITNIWSRFELRGILRGLNV